MTKLNAYLFFDGNCRDAMNFYKDIFGGELVLMPVGESPAAQHMPPETHQKIMHSMLSTAGIVLMASDMINGEKIENGNTISLCLTFTSKEEMQSLFDKLAGGGNVTSPLKDEFFGTFGALTDKFDMKWMFEWGPENK